MNAFADFVRELEEERKSRPPTPEEIVQELLFRLKRAEVESSRQQRQINKEATRSKVLCKKEYKLGNTAIAKTYATECVRLQGEIQTCVQMRSNLVLLRSKIQSHLRSGHSTECLRRIMRQMNRMETKPTKMGNFMRVMKQFDKNLKMMKDMNEEFSSRFDPTEDISENELQQIQQILSQVEAECDMSMAERLYQPEMGVPIEDVSVKVADPGSSSRSMEKVAVDESQAVVDNDMANLMNRINALKKFNEGTI